MSSIVAVPVPSCSGSATRKRKNDSDNDSSGIRPKLSKGKFYFVLDSESDIPTEDEEETESLQNKSTDFAKDTSDTSSKSSRFGSDFEVEFEVVSLSEQEVKVPFDSTSSASGTDSETWRRRQKHFEEEASDMSDRSDSSRWADNSSLDEPADKFTVPARHRACLKCQASTPVHYCQTCYKVRKDFLPARPKGLKKNKKRRPFLKKKGQKESPKGLAEEKVESGIESGSSQEILTGEPEAPVENSLCNICFKNPKNGAFVHNKWIHIYSCYKCSIKIWFTNKCCPLCNLKVNNVLKVAIA